MELEFISEKFSRDIEVLATDHNDVLTVENLFCNSRGKTTWELVHWQSRWYLPRRCPLPSMTTVFSKEVIFGEVPDGLLVEGSC